MPLLEPAAFRHYVDRFNRDDEETVVQHVPNSATLEWFEHNVPLFECPDEAIQEAYYFRWWVYRKHVKWTADGFIVTEFHSRVPWAGKHNSINCGAGHHLYEGRWLRNSAAFAPDYARFWFRGGGSLRSYSVWLVDAITRYCDVIGEHALAVDLLPDFVANYEAWEQSNQHASGLFWSNDDRDAMELSISGPGLRPTLNAYLYADARAIARTAKRAGQSEIERRFTSKADALKRLFQERLWDADAGFFKVIPLASKTDAVKTWDWHQIDPASNVREQLGYIPWYFSLPDAGFEIAWRQLTDEHGFDAPFGPTTAERRHPRFMYPHPHECLWNGPSWPFATAQTLTAMANLLTKYDQSAVSKADYLDLLHRYAACHQRTRSDRKRIAWLDENIDPLTGEWLSRKILESMGWPPHKGGRERGKDYNHSTFCDLVISGLIGVQTDDADGFAINPLLPADTWDYFCLDQLPYHGQLMTIVFDKTGNRYGRGSGLSIYADGVRIAHAPEVRALRAG
jgi:hypothetical protein